MKKTHLVAIIAVAIAIGVIVATAGDASSYVNFDQAKQLHASGSSQSVHVVGRLQKNMSGQIINMSYRPQVDPDYFTFHLIDQAGKVQKVVYLNPKPQDFERSEQIVIIGNYTSQEFLAKKILMKCPSKYQENEFKEVNTTAKPSQANF